MSFPPLRDLRSPFSGHRDNRLFKALRDEAREIAWLLALVGALSATGVMLAVLLAATS
jgi:hypothetical protein